MTEQRDMALLLLVPALMISMAPTLGAQSPTSPLPSGNRIVAQDGDVVVVLNDARVKIVRRRDAYVRAVANAAEGWLLLLVDQAMSGSAPDGRVEWTYFFRDIEGTWPFEARWEGNAAIEEYSAGSGGLGIATPQGLVQLFAGSQEEFRDRNALAVLSYTSSGSGGGNQLGWHFER